jgi:Phasin protein
MAQSKEERGHLGNSFMGGGLKPTFTNPMLTILADMNATFLEGWATAQKDWADFVQRRTREDVAPTRQLLKSHSVAGMHQIYSQYVQTAFQQYRDQSEKVVQRSESIAQHLAATEVSTKEAARARH